ncbi:MAG: S-layer homology domain-containing protein, partial [Rubrobacteridae bacterium]|nr:S-layer homology domain-containing protein [Rubrobacteridae bacterium]
MTSTSPSNNETNVSKTSNIKITFGENITAGSNYDQIKLRNPNSAEVKLTKEISGKVLTLDPLIDLERIGQYTVTIPVGAIKYNSGKSLASEYVFQFNTTSGTTSGPVVVSTNPSNSATGASRESDITVVFDLDLQTDTNYNNITLKDPKDATVSTALSISSKTLTINPTNNLVDGAYYTVTIPSSSVKDTSGKSMTYQYKFTFRVTKDSNAPSAPQSINVSPSSNNIALSWNNNSESDLAGYNVYRKLKTGSSFSKLNSSLISNAQYTDSTVQSGQSYTYYVTAVDRSDNESGKSSEISATAANVLGTLAFSDVAANSWYANYVSRLISNKILSGYPNGTFKPGSPITRAEFSKALVLTMGLGISTPTNPTFTDVPAGNWAYAYIETARSKGIINGYGDGEFRPINFVTRAEMTQMISLALGLSASQASFSDTSSHWARNYIGSCANKG